MKHSYNEKACSACGDIDGCHLVVTEAPSAQNTREDLGESDLSPNSEELGHQPVRREDLSATPICDVIKQQFPIKDQNGINWLEFVDLATAEKLERENNRLRAKLAPRNGHTFKSLQKMWEDAHVEITALNSKLSDEQFARTEITRKYHGECSELAHKLHVAEARLADAIHILMFAKSGIRFNELKVMIDDFLSSTEPPAK